MNFKTPLRTLIPAAVLLLAAAGPASAAYVYPFRIDLLGTPSTPQAAGRTIRIGPNTQHVNVVRNDVVRFLVGDKEFTWIFNGPLQVAAVELNRIAPSGLLDHQVVAYISPDPLTDTPSL